MAVVGIIGGVACGKSFIADQLRSLGAEVIDVDKLGHEVLREDDVRDALVRRWGDAILDSGGDVDRAAVARRVFATNAQGPGNLEFLEGLVHPRIGQRIRARIEAIRLERPDALVVVDAALLIEAGWARFCDKIVFVEASRQRRWERAKRRGWSEAEFSAREASQANLAMKRKQSDGVIDNNGSAGHTFLEVQQFWRTLN